MYHYFLVCPSQYQWSGCLTLPALPPHLQLISSGLKRTSLIQADSRTTRYASRKSSEDTKGPQFTRQNSFQGRKNPNSVQRTKRGRMSPYLKDYKAITYCIYKQICLKKIDGLAQSVLNVVVITFMDRDACLESILVYVQIKVNAEGGEFSFFFASSVLSNEKKKEILSNVEVVTGVEGTSLSASAPACVAVWGWGSLAGCAQRRARPPASGTAPGPGG